MAVTVEKLYKYSTKHYQMKLLAGDRGMNNLVQWVHIIEDEEVGAFLHGGELVFTAGIRSGNGREEWLLEFAESLYMSGASAFIINLGPHIQKVPDKVISYCNEIGMPLFVIPWETRMVDMTRDFCQQIFHSEVVEDTIATTLKNILFHIGNQDTQVMQMERYGYREDSSYCFLVIAQADEGIPLRMKLMERLEQYGEKTAHSIKDTFIHFIYKELLILVLVDYSAKETENFIKYFLEQIRYGMPTAKYYIGVGSNQSGLTRQEEHFANAVKTAQLAESLGESILYYDSLDLYKLLMQVKAPGILREYYDELVGKLEKYDEENGTALFDFMEKYIENNASAGQVAERIYIHRNTVNNNLKKIEKITGYDLRLLENQVRCVVSLKIRNLKL